MLHLKLEIDLSKQQISEGLKRCVVHFVIHRFAVMNQNIANRVKGCINEVTLFKGKPLLTVY